VGVAGASVMSSCKSPISQHFDHAKVQVGSLISSLLQCWRNDREKDTWCPK